MTKITADTVLFAGPNAAREGTVFAALRQFVTELDKGEGVPYGELEAYMFENWTPKTAKNYDGSYIKSYARDALNKLGHLSSTAVSETTAENPTSEAEVSGDVGQDTSSQDLSVTEALSFIKTRGDVNSVDEIGSTQITAEDIADELGKQIEVVNSFIKNATAEGFLTTQEVDGVERVYLTEAGFNHIS